MFIDGREWEAMEDARNSRLLAIAKGVMAARGIVGVWMRQRAVRITLRQKSIPLICLGKPYRLAASGTMTQSST